MPRLTPHEAEKQATALTFAMLSDLDVWINPASFQEDEARKRRERLSRNADEARGVLLHENVDFSGLRDAIDGHYQAKLSAILAERAQRQLVLSSSEEVPLVAPLMTYVMESSKRQASIPAIAQVVVNTRDPYGALLGAWGIYYAYSALERYKNQKAEIERGIVGQSRALS